MNCWTIVYICLLCAFQYMYWKFKESFKLQYQIHKSQKIDFFKFNIMFYVSDRGMFSSDKDLKKIKSISTKGSYSKHVFKDSGQQEMLYSLQQIKKIKKTLKKYGKRIIRFLKKLTWKDLVTITFYTLAPCAVLRIMHIEKVSTVYQQLLDNLLNNSVDLYLAQVSLTFITISVMSIFSDGNMVIYWQNVVKQMLIEPIGRCFKAYFVYSFIYLLGSTISLILKYGEGVIVFFFFNILCLFELSRIMINCYYGQKNKQEKLTKEFIGKIEKANIAQLYLTKNKSSNKDESRNYIDEIINTFGMFNYYTTDAYDNKKYIVVKENLSVYGKLLAHVDPETLKPEQFPLLEWYSDKTRMYYRNVVKKYYLEYFSFILGDNYSNTVPPRCTIEKKIIYEIIFKLSNDVSNPFEAEDCYDLILYKFLVMIYLAARLDDQANLEQYRIEIEDYFDGNWLKRNKKLVFEKFEMLLSAYENTKSNLGIVDESSVARYLHRCELRHAVAELIGDLVLINTKNVNYFDFSWIPVKKICAIDDRWSENKKDVCARDNLINSITKYVEQNCQKLTKQRKIECLKRLEMVVDHLYKCFEVKENGKKINKSE